MDQTIWRAERVCGLNSLYLLLRSAGKDPDYTAMQAELVKDELASLYDIKKSSESYGLPLAIARLDPDDLRNAPKPLIAHTEVVGVRGTTGGHFVVVIQADHNEITYLDGTTVRTHTEPWQSFEKVWTGYAALRDNPAGTAGGAQFAALLGGVMMGCSIIWLRSGWRAGVRLSPPRLMTRLQGLFTAITLLMAIPGASWAQTTGADRLTEEYRRKTDTIRTIQARVEVSSRPLIAEANLFRDFRSIPSDKAEGVVTYHRDGRFRIETIERSKAIFDGVVNKLIERNPRLQSNFDEIFQVPYDEIRALTEEVRAQRPAPRLRSTVYDGSKFWQYDADYRVVDRGDKLRVFNIVDLERFPDGILDRTLFEDLLLTFEVAGLPHDAERRREDILPAMLASGKFRVSDHPEDVNGNPCTVIASADEKICLDPKYGFAVRKRTWSTGGVPYREVVANNFERLADGLYFPQAMLETSFGMKDQAGEQYIGKPYIAKQFTIKRVELNKPNLEAELAVNIPAGSWILDQTVTPVDDQGRSIKAKQSDPNMIAAVNYRMPANRSDLDQAVQDARVAAGHRIQESNKPNKVLAALVAFNVGLLAILAAAYGTRRWRQGKTSDPSNRS